MIELNRDQQTALLLHARNTIAALLDIPVTAKPDLGDEVFNNRCGAFVTLHERGRLRGCIGYIQGVRSIPEAVTDMARASAFRDPRFPALTADEFGRIDIEISILSPVETVGDVSDIQVGRDGLIISRDRQSGLLLPQVAVEQGWDLGTFIEHTCYKAGLPGNAWNMKGTKIEKFSAQVFGEIELGMVP